MCVCVCVCCVYAYREPEQERLPQASAVVAWVERVIDHALGAAADDLTSNLKILTESTSWLVQDAAMLGIAVGHAGVVVRRSVLWTTRAPDYEFEDCTHEDCPDRTVCSGNIILELPDDPQAEGAHRCRMHVKRINAKLYYITQSTGNKESAEDIHLLYSSMYSSADMK
jgi:hypothetical protein